MKLTMFLLLGTTLAFGKGTAMPHVTGIGGIFFKAKGSNTALAAWYQQHLGIRLESWGGAVLRWSEDPTKDKGATVWVAAEKDTKWFEPSQSNFMINYRVDDLPGMVANLQKAGIKVQGPEASEQGNFAWVMDPDGNKVELWEPGK
jgi:predicted enzyme related to lactoylglutathione lyase